MSIADIIDAAVEREFPRLLILLAALVRTPSDNPPGDCAAHAEIACRELENLGFAVERHAVPAAAVQAAGMISATNLIVRRKFGPDDTSGPTIALNAHGDVVPPGLGWTHDPYGAQVEEGPQGPTMFGRGVAVSKSDFATYAGALLALDAVAATGEALAGTVELHFTHDEETGGTIGPQWILEQGLSKPDFAICAGFSYGVVTAHNGCLHLEVTVTGKQAHAAMPETGSDALETATAILAALYEKRRQLGNTRSGVAGIVSPTLNVGLISGGINTNVVPDRVTFRLDRRIIPEENPSEVEDELRALIVGASRAVQGASHATHVDVRRVLLATPLAPLPGGEKLSAALHRQAARVFQTEIPEQGVPIYTDARHYAGQGIPTVLYGAGPRSLLEANGHNAEENLRLNDLKGATKVVAAALAELLRP
jgi:acetylornithine deacetylase/succinyl-diaminopimelate desuccinylase-like protein